MAEYIAAGLREVLPDAQIDMVPMADGGEGTAEVISNALGAAWIECPAHDSLGRAIQARFAWSEADKLGVMEMSETAGLRRLRADERDPTRASTFGVGEMMLAAARRGAQQTHYRTGRQRDERWRLWNGARFGISLLRRSGERAR